MNLRQGGMSVKEYSLKFTQLSKHALTLVANPRARMNKFVMVVSRLVEEECRKAILIHDMTISRFLVYAQQIEETKLKKMNRDVKSLRTQDGNLSKGRFEAQGTPRFKNRFSNQGTSSTPKVNKDMVPTPKPQGGSGGGSYVERLTCAKFGKKHGGKCLVGTNECFSCCKSGHMKRGFLLIRAQGREGKQVPPSGSNSDAPKKNHFYALQSRSDQEGSPNAVTGVLQVFTINVYALLDPGATLSFVTPSVAMKFDVLPVKNANAAPPVPDQEVSSAEFRNAFQMLAQSVVNQNNQRAPVPVNANVGFFPIELSEARA
ncbi:uncharacterized protein LOC125845741 [Solanum stenotomum]|uniref:uncharacterized protein LOC125845741 n=1 Tax=Solanum stenotomum TaxID=172797 RepID=UPI0020CFE9DB|nr:uncharacterized protein LOC125845741 [Solanum stenotomum]